MISPFGIVSRRFLLVVEEVRWSQTAVKMFLDFTQNCSHHISPHIGDCGGYLLRAFLVRSGRTDKIPNHLHETILSCASSQFIE